MATVAFVQRWWSVMMLVGIVLIPAAVVKPSANPSFPPELVELDKSIRFVTSLPFLGCMTALVAGLAWMRRYTFLASPVEYGIAVWYLTNGCWWSGGCDVLSGFFAVMPNLSEHYLVIDTKHSTNDGKDRGGLDAVYLAELLIHVPTSIAVFHALVTRAPYARTLEAFLCGCQVVGTFAYYLPEVFVPTASWPDGGLALYGGIYFGLLWVVLPLAILAWRCAQDVAAANANKQKRV